MPNEAAAAACFVPGRGGGEDSARPMQHCLSCAGSKPSCAQHTIICSRRGAERQCHCMHKAQHKLLRRSCNRAPPAPLSSRGHTPASGSGRTPAHTVPLHSALSLYSYSHPCRSASGTGPWDAELLSLACASQCRSSPSPSLQVDVASAEMMLSTVLHAEPSFHTCFCTSGQASANCSQEHAV